jgi:hypothetical protein
LRRKIIIATALLGLVVGVSAAYAATLNTYKATVTFTSSKPGTAAKPVEIGYTETLAAENAVSSKIAAPLVNIKTTIYGLVSNLKDFKTCSEAVFTKPPYNAACPKGSEVGSGTVNSFLGNPSLLKKDQPPKGTNPIPCNPDITVYNAGGGKEWYFFTAASATQCSGLTTGATAPYPGTVKQSGKNLVINVPLPADVSTAVAGTQNFYGSLVKEVIKVTPASTKVKGKTVFSQASVACKGGKRPYSVTFTAVPKAGSPGQSATVNGSAKC